MMKILLALVGALLVGSPGLTQSVPDVPQSQIVGADDAIVAAPAVVYVVTYLEVQRRSARKGAALLEHYVQGTRGSAGNLGAQALQELERAERFALVETWQDTAAFNVHESGRGEAFREEFRSIQRSPPDPRVTHGFALDPQTSIAGARTIYVMAHVDVPGARRLDGENVLKLVCEPSRANPGHVRFDVYQQNEPRANHFTLFAAWRDRAAFDAYTETLPWREFREALAPMLGAPYDERLYRGLEP